MCSGRKTAGTSIAVTCKPSDSDLDSSAMAEVCAAVTAGSMEGQQQLQGESRPAYEAVEGARAVVGDLDGLPPVTRRSDDHHVVRLG